MLLSRLCKDLGFHPVNSEKLRGSDGLVVAALACNAAAKFIDPEYYDYKPELIEKAIRESGCPCWYNDGVVYFDTVIGQLSFHVFDEDGDFETMLPSANGREWIPRWNQDFIIELLEVFFNDSDPFNEVWLERFLDGHFV
jgi:hypothetical protein